MRSFSYRNHIIIIIIIVIIIIIIIINYLKLYMTIGTPIYPLLTETRFTI